MLSILLSATLAVLALTTTNSASAMHHQRRTIPTVVPGPGLPSLASLNLTSAALYAMNRTVLPDGVNYDQECAPGDTAMVAISDVTACFNYLVAIGSDDCGPGTLCTAGTAVVTAGGSQECITIAVVVQEIIVRCGIGAGDGGSNDGGETGPSVGVAVRNAQFPCREQC